MGDRENKKAVLAEAKKAIAAKDYALAFCALKGAASSGCDFSLQARFASLFAAIPAAALALPPLRLAVLSSGTASHLVPVIKFLLACEGLGAEVFESEYDTVHQAILDPQSALYAFKPEITLILTNYRDVRISLGHGAAEEDVKTAVHTAVRSAAGLWAALKNNSGCHVIQSNADIPAHRVLGNYEGSVPWSRLGALRLYNLELAKAAPPGVSILDMEAISSAFGKTRWHDARFWYHSKHTFSLDATGLVASGAAKIIGAIKGLAKKCVVLDLDNTLWGGVIGDDGVGGIALGSGPDGEAFADFQGYLKRLKERGIILAVCSKNEEEAAREPFLKHPDMQLKLEDISVFKASWGNKADAIRQIAAELNIGLDSMVFVDDNPAERQLVRAELPEVSVLELPADPAAYVDALDGAMYFETVAFSAEDVKRGDYYRDNAVRAGLQQQCSNIEDYLKKLEMTAVVGELDHMHLPRIAQLINKSNQFHLTTTRYTESDLAAMTAAPGCRCVYFKLKDRFGDNGLISAVILKAAGGDTLEIDTWVMSCRVLARTMEEFICGEIVGIARRGGYKKIRGRYLPTKKNKLVERLYERLNFKLISEGPGGIEWELDLSGPVPNYAGYIAKAGAVA